MNLSSVSLRTPNYYAYFLWLLAIVLPVGALVASANVVIPLEPVPFSLQLLTVMLSALLLPARASLFSVVLYVLAAFVYGKPVAAGNPILTGGYLLGFVMATALIVYAWPALKSSKRMALRMGCAAVLPFAAVALVHVAGFLWLHNVLLAAHPEQTLFETFMVGTAPFLPYDFLKAGIMAFPAVILSRL